MDRAASSSAAAAVETTCVEWLCREQGNKVLNSILALSCLIGIITKLRDNLTVVPG